MYERYDDDVDERGALLAPYEREQAAAAPRGLAPVEAPRYEQAVEADHVTSQKHLASMVAHGIYEFQAASTAARPLTKKQQVVVRHVLLPFEWSERRAPPTITLNRAFMERRFRDSGIDFSRGVYVRKIEAKTRSTTSPYDVAPRVRGLDSEKPDEVAALLMRPGDYKEYTTLITRGDPQTDRHEVWANATDPTMIEQHASFDYATELERLQPAPSARGVSHTEVQCAEATPLGELLVANEPEISNGRGFKRTVFTGDDGVDEVVLQVNKVKAKEVLDYYHKNYLGQLITTRFDKDHVKIDLVRPDHEDESPARVHEFSASNAGATASAINSAKVVQRASLELIIHLVKNVDE